MRKLLLAFAATLSVGAGAQVFNVNSLAPVALPPDVGSKVVAISGQGDFFCSQPTTIAGSLSWI